LSSMDRCVGSMVTTSIAGSRMTVRRDLSALLLAVFISVQVTAVAHELHHVLGHHDASCGLHVAADHLAMVPAPEAALARIPGPVAGAVATALDVLLPPPSRPSDARAPPLSF
jgi:hypothetical protein